MLSTMSLHFYFEAHDPFIRGIDVIIGNTSNKLGPIFAMLAYLVCVELASSVVLLVSPFLPQLLVSHPSVPRLALQ